MTKAWKQASLVFAAAVAAQLFIATPASAHHTNISATAVCDTTVGGFVINYESVSWYYLGFEGGNSRIDILFNGVAVASGAYVAPTFRFSGSLPAPAGAGPGSTVTVTALAVNVWDDGYPAGQSSSVAVTLPEEPCGNQAGLGRFTGGGSQVRVGGARITRGLTIHCDLLLSNNLEVNWGGDKFHMTEHLTTVECSDSPDIIQFPPAAPLDTLIGVGTGRYNNVDGFTIKFTLVDYGEPGNLDQAALLIYETANPSNVVLNVPLQLLSGGNLQAHYDQPHK
jgi:hypothetical protein